MKHRVIDPKGIHVEGKHVAKGQVVALADGAALKAFVHFKQVTLVEDPTEKPAPEPPGNGSDKEPEKPKK